MAKRELSSTLRNLKFMQRAALREEKTKKEELQPDLAATTTVTRRCVVIMEGDPHPGAARGRMSFQSFNPSVDKLNEEEAKLQQPAAETNISRNQSGNESFRENNSTTEGSERVNGNGKRKQSEVNCEEQFPNKSPKNDDDVDNQSTPKNSLGSFRKPNVDKLDWNVLRSSKAKQKR
ncbi:hypothetical protein HN51_042830 [Arachis hypogaea]|uniref:M-phase phosphoprotein n=1 Tax=Arachis hypogaea TaxID=3818 RepID=A0A444Y876_ARAHY|nr:uncharacterized protein LOC107612145 [Arachis ipaensis]XP_025671459.1 uncharacterized protein LOC112771079 [Arachis hypogaea]QHN94984.1 uncharacterized protein DS421_18g605780 [Arachis hypogaea]RYQ98138.1 hypothetical protein Ahy_B08g094209 [Arachis hypogaea]